MLVIDTGNSGDLVTQHAFNVLLWDAKRSHMARNGTADVVEGPIAEADNTVKTLLRLGVPARWRQASVGGKQIPTGAPDRQVSQYV